MGMETVDKENLRDARIFVYGPFGPFLAVFGNFFQGWILLGWRMDFWEISRIVKFLSMARSGHFRPVFNGSMAFFKFFPDPEISHAGPAEKNRFRDDIF